VSFRRRTHDLTLHPPLLGRTERRARPRAFAAALLPLLGWRFRASRRVRVLTTFMSQPRTPRLVSVGYEGRDADDLVGFLRSAEVNVLVDVRLNPISRKPGLSKTKLAEVLAANGIGYIHYRELGNPKDNRDGFRAGKQSALNRFRALLQDEKAERALGHVSELLDREVVALLCFEHSHEACHRGLVAEALADRTPSLSVKTV
jgi:hypothetical protein